MSDAIAKYSTAKGYVQSSYVIMASPNRFKIPNDTTFFLSFHMLCGFAVELYLKSFLTHAGYSERTLTRELGHNLQRLHETARAEGLDDFQEGMLVQLLNKHHGSNEFRYAKRATEYRTANLNEIFLAFSTLDFGIDATVGASASVGKTPGGFWKLPKERSMWRL
ncbi:hypothetical protein [Bosea caraganae]|uniref:hypothetical protein n=1 Tax=Bosea caraganae TaxID=2763117 RepID=UPI0011C04211|nr:hypothetical protein [Bosea caraganae]